MDTGEKVIVLVALVYVLVLQSVDRQAAAQQQVRQLDLGATAPADANRLSDQVYLGRLVNLTSWLKGEQLAKGEQEVAESCTQLALSLQTAQTAFVELLARERHHRLAQLLADGHKALKGLQRPSERPGEAQQRARLAQEALDALGAASAQYLQCVADVSPDLGQDGLEFPAGLANLLGRLAELASQPEGAAEASVSSFAELAALADDCPPSLLSSLVMKLVAVDACLSHGLRRRALGLFKTNSSVALMHKVAKSCPSADQVLTMVEQQQQDQQQQQQQQQQQLNKSMCASPQHQNSATNNGCSTGNRSFGVAKQPASNSEVHRRNAWIKCALIENKLVPIVEFLAENADKYYEADALMSNLLCAHILCSLLVGPSALEFRCCKSVDSYQEDPTADELLRRHKFANPIACLCSPARQASQSQVSLVGADQTQLQSDGHSSPSLLSASQTIIDSQEQQELRQNSSELKGGRAAGATRRRPLALKTNVRRGTLVTDCHHYACQELSEHQHTRGYTFLTSSTPSSAPTCPSGQANCNGQQANGAPMATMSLPGGCQQSAHEWPLWSPRMLHDTLHQNPSSRLLYAKNNVLLEVQPNQTIAGYLSLHQTCTDELLLKWIPNQMINGGQSNGQAQPDGGGLASNQSVESSCIGLVLSLPVSRIVLLHCQLFSGANRSVDWNSNTERPSADVDPENSPDSTSANSHSAHETLILVEADGVQRAPFRFPKGGLRLFLACLESGLRPGKYLDPAIKFDDSPSDPLEWPARSPSSSSSAGEPNAAASRLDSLLRRLPSLKRKATPPPPPPPQQQPQRTAELPERPEPPETLEQPGGCRLSSYVYRIVSVNQLDHSLATPPHSAPSVGSSSSPSSLQVQRSVPDSQQSEHPQRFRWSLSRLTRFSSKYRASGSSLSANSLPNASVGSTSSQHQLTLADSNSLACDTLNDASLDQISESATGNNGETLEGAGDRLSARELARFEAKLEDLSKSTSDELLALRTQSVQALCQSMRRQIVARAFYGWLVYCRKTKIVRAHLAKLIHPSDQCYLLDLQTASSERLAMSGGLTRAYWTQLNSSSLGRPQIRLRVNQLVYYGGVDGNELRREVWPYLLEHYQFGDSQAAREAKDVSVREAYESSARDWSKVELIVRQRDRELLAANIAKASRDSKNTCKTSDTKASGTKAATDQTQQTNRGQAEGQGDKSAESEEQSDISEEANLPDHAEAQPVDLQTGEANKCKQLDTNDDNNNSSLAERRASLQQQAKEVKLAAKRRRRRRRRYRLESTGSVSSDASITDQFGNNIHRIDKDVQRCDRSFWYFKDTKNLDKLKNIMCSYVWQHLDVGYVQGMCDLAAPFLVIFDDEILAFSCFSQLMKRMVANFPHGCAMDQNFESLKHLMQVLDPKLFELLQSNGDYTHFYFCYRWLLLDFKRELAYADVYRVWETIWSARRVVSDHFVVFLALAMVRYYRDIIIENNMDFTDTIKFFNEMAERHDAKRIIALAQDSIVELKSLIDT